jgi:hypothetical protein
MSKYKVIKVKIPDLPTPYRSGNINYSSAKDKAGNMALIRSIKATYGGLIAKWGTVFEIDDGIIIGFIATESGGKMLPPNKFKATGLMQCTPNALWEGVKKWKAITKTDLPEQARAVLNAQVPTILTLKADRPDALSEKRILTALQSSADFNIMAGTLVLRWSLERFSSTITGGQLNKAMVAYNAGAYTQSLNTSGKPIITPIDTLVLATNRLVPLESRNYLYKMLGVDGFLSLIYKDKVI